MEIFGEFERLFATNLYPLRVPIAIALAVAALLVLRTAVSNRWDLVARAHPQRTAAIVVPVLVVGLPLAWYLGSPLFIRTELTEEEPPSGGMVVVAGEFTGADEFHFGSGTASIVETATGTYVLRFEQFSVRNGPDLFVYLSPTVGYADDAIEIGTLRATDGSFSYELPPGIDPASFQSVVIWCKQFAVLFATAPLAAG